MRAAFLFLLLANLAFFAWTHYLAPPTPATDPRPLTRQVDPAAIHILTAAQVAKIAAPGPPPALTPAPTSAPNPVPRSARAAASPPPLAAAECLEWGPLNATQATRAAQALAPLELGRRLSQRVSGQTFAWWVYIPSQGSAAEAEKEAVELKELGVKDYFIVQDHGAQRWAISLGVFRKRPAAETRLRDLQTKKVHNAKLGPYATQNELVRYEVRDVGAALRAKLERLAQEYPGTSVQSCPAANPQ